jgi:hypothetical protein
MDGSATANLRWHRWHRWLAAATPTVPCISANQRYAVMLIIHPPNRGFGSLAHTWLKYLPGFSGGSFSFKV